MVGSFHLWPLTVKALLVFISDPFSNVQTGKVNDPAKQLIKNKTKSLLVKLLLQISSSQLCLFTSDRWPHTHWQELKPTSTELHQTTKTVVRLIWPSTRPFLIVFTNWASKVFLFCVCIVLVFHFLPEKQILFLPTSTKAK